MRRVVEAHVFTALCSVPVLLSEGVRLIPAQPPNCS